MLSVFLTQDCFLYGNAPVYSQALIQDTYSAVNFRMIELITLVLEDSRLAQYGKSVCKAFVNEELALVILTQFYCYVLAVGGASFADIYCYVQHGTTHATQQFALGVWGALEVEASHYSVT